MSTATRLRRLDESAEITVFERGDHVSFANCGLPYHAGGVIADRADLLLQTPQTLADRFGIVVKVGHEVTDIDRDRGVVVARDRGTGGVVEAAFDHVVLSTGASPILAPIEGIKRAFTLRDVEDVDRITERIDSGVREAVVIGAGFIGLEVAENLVRRGISVTVVERAGQVLPPLDPELAAPVAHTLMDHGVELRLGVEVASIGADRVRLADGELVPAQLVLSSIGVRPDSELARASGLELGPHGGVVVDDRQVTSDPRIFAVGDVAEKADAISGLRRLIPLANLANRHGRLVADVIAGHPVRSRPSVGTAIVKVFGLTAAVTGWNERQLTAAGRDFHVVRAHPGSHAGYYPGAKQLSLKLIFDPETHEILGAQAVGEDGADKRIDVIATAMAGGITAPQLADLELAYAPPYGSAKDPVNLLGYRADNVITGVSRDVQWHELAAAQESGALLVNVLDEAMHETHKIPGAINIPTNELRGRLAELPRERPVVLYCRVGQGSHTAARILRQHGRDVRTLDGGYTTWRQGKAAGELARGLR
jgi:NADPH-dependent 2,4-dienoyl-CoA reductase/sulfur reductase-like enzyme/rhodanese-related sulfurtransferase